MKLVILAGGLGSRLSEETLLHPKPLVEIGGRPIIWHIMKIYAAHGISDFIVCCGYKGYLLKEYFVNYFLHSSDVCVDLGNNFVEIIDKKSEAWRVTLVDTGDTTQTGGRIRRIAEYISDQDSFCLTYGDGLGTVNITKLVEFHRGHGLLCTMTVVQPPGRFGAVELSNTRVDSFQEKPQGDGNWINGGFFVLKPKALELISGDNISWEKEPLEQLARRGQLQAFRHEGFWQAMDTLRDKVYLNELWVRGSAPWKVW